MVQLKIQGPMSMANCGKDTNGYQFNFQEPFPMVNPSKDY